MTWDPLTDKQILTLDPRLQPIATDFINYFFSQKNMFIRITCAFRSNENQHRYYLQGRDSPGKIITFADSGMSFHNYGLAFDICKIIGDKASFEIPFSFLSEAAKMFELTWGGNFKFHDYMHFEKKYGHPISWYKEGNKS